MYQEEYFGFDDLVTLLREDIIKLVRLELFFSEEVEIVARKKNTDGLFIELDLPFH